MDILWSEFTAGLTGPDEWQRVIIRLLSALVFGSVIGLQRQRVGKAAGLRTHILVALGAALFVTASISTGMENDARSRIIQGIVTGIGFIGTGTIVKLSDRLEVHGLTTAAGLFMTAAVGVAVGLGRIGIGVIATALTLIVLSVLTLVDASIRRQDQSGTQT